MHVCLTDDGNLVRRCTMQELTRPTFKTDLEFQPDPKLGVGLLRGRSSKRVPRWSYPHIQLGAKTSNAAMPSILTLSFPSTTQGHRGREELGSLVISLVGHHNPSPP